MGEDHISKVGCIIQNTIADTFPMHTHNFYEFFYVVSGKAIHLINQTTQIISEGSLFFVRPDDTHSYSFLNSFDMELISCGFESCLVNDVCQLLDIDTSFITEPQLPLYIQLIPSVRWEFLNDFKQIKQKPAGIERRQYFLTILPKLIYLFYTMDIHQADVLPLWFAKLIEEMNQTQNFTSGLKKMISLANVSQEHLNREFRKYLKITPTEYINIKRIEYAGKLLLTREYEITDICFMCGYNNLSYFYQMFKRQYHCTPIQFIQKYSPNS